MHFVLPDVKGQLPNVATISENLMQIGGILLRNPIKGDLVFWRIHVQIHRGYPL